MGLSRRDIQFIHGEDLEAQSCGGVEDRFAAERAKAAGKRISISKIVATVLSRRPVDCPLHAGNESLAQVGGVQVYRFL